MSIYGYEQIINKKKFFASTKMMFIPIEFLEHFNICLSMYYRSKLYYHSFKLFYFKRTVMLIFKVSFIHFYTSSSTFSVYYPFATYYVYDEAD